MPPIILDATSQIVNPAGLAVLLNQVNLGASFFSPRRAMTGSGNPGFVPIGTVDSDSEYFVIPEFALNYRIDDASALGVAVYGNGGMNTDYGAVACNPMICGPSGSGVFCGGKAGVDLTQVFYNQSIRAK